MKRAVLLAFLLVTGPACAEEPRSDVEEGSSLMQEGAKLLFRGLMADAMEDLGPTLNTMEGLARVIGDIDQFQPPEVLPNGDVILRRKVPLVPGRPEPGPEGDIDL